MKENSLKQFVSDTIVNFSIENSNEVDFARDENGVITGAIKEGVKSIPTGGHTVAKGLRYPAVGFVRGATNSALAGLAGGAGVGAVTGGLINGIKGYATGEGFIPSAASGALTGAKVGGAIGGVGGLLAAPAVGVAKGSWDTLDRVGNTSKPSVIKQLGTTATTALGAAGGAILGGVVGHNIGEGHAATGAKIGAGLGAGAGLLASLNANRDSRDDRPFINPDMYYVLEMRNKNDIRLVGNKGGYGNRDAAIIRGEDYDAMSNYNVSVLKGSTVLDYYPDQFRSEYTAVRNFSDIEKVAGIYVTKKREQLNPNDQVICVGRLKQKNSHVPTRSESQNRNWLANKYTFSVLKDKDYYYSANSENEAEQIVKDVLNDRDGIVVKLLPAGDLDNKQTMDPIGRALLGL